MEAQVRGARAWPLHAELPCGSSRPTHHPPGRVQPSPAWPRGPSWSLVTASLKMPMPISVWRQFRARLCPGPSTGTQKGGLTCHQGLGQGLPAHQGAENVP